MAKTDTRNVPVTVAQIQDLQKAGCEVVRVAVPDRQAALVLGEIRKRIAIPLVADIHFDYRLALEAIDQGVDGLRLNPGNIQDRKQVDRVIRACRERRIPIRVGVNEGGIIERKDKDLRAAEKAALEADYEGHLVGIMVRVLQRLGSRHVLVLPAADGMDEISINTTTYIAELKDGEISEYTVTPEQFGMKCASNDLLRVANAEEACAMLTGVLNNQPGAPRDIVQLNAGAAIYAAGLSASLEEGIKRAGEVIASGDAKAKLDQLIGLSNQL